MSSAVPVAVPATGSWSVVRWSGLAILLLVELLTLTIQFDTGSLQGDTRWWALLLGEAHYLPQLALTGLVAIVLFGGERIRIAFVAALQVRHEPLAWSRALAVHAAGFMAFTGLTARLLNDTTAGAASFAAWGLAAVVMLGGWCLALMPLAAWMRLLRELGWGVVLVAVLVGTLGFAAGQVSESLWGRLADATLAAVRILLDLGFVNVMCQPAERILGAEGFAVRIAPSCSGYEGLGLVAAFAGMFIVLRRDELRFPHAVLLLPLGLAAAWLANVLRITGLIALGASGWPHIALGGFHSQAGWLGFNVVALGLVVAARRSRFFARQAESVANPVVPYLAPLAAVVGCAMLTSALAANGFDALYGVRVLVAGLVLACFSKHYAKLGWSAHSWAALGIGGAVVVLWIGIGYATLDDMKPSPIPVGLAAMSAPLAVAWLVVRTLGAVVIVPIAEELAFRGYLLRRLQSADFETVAPTRWSWPAVLASSLLFGLLHPGWWFAGTLAGIGYAAAYWYRGRLADAVIAHAVTNALLAVFVLTTDNWYFW